MVFRPTTTAPSRCRRRTAVVLFAATAADLCSAFQPTAPPQPSSAWRTGACPPSSFDVSSDRSVPFALSRRVSRLSTAPPSSTGGTAAAAATATTSTTLYGKLWDKLKIEADHPSWGTAWYVINCVAGSELELLSQCRQTCGDLPKDTVEKFVVPTERHLRSHGNRNVVDVKVRYPGYVFCKIRMCPEVYEPLQNLDLCRSWMGTVNRKGYRKLPPAPVALSEEEVAKFKGLEEEQERYEEKYGEEFYTGKKDAGADLLEQYAGYEVDGMVKILHGNFAGEDGVIRRLKDGQLCVRMYTYGQTFDEWFDPKDVRPMTDLEVMRGLGGPTSSVGQREFEVSIGKRDPFEDDDDDAGFLGGAGARSGGRTGEQRSNLIQSIGGGGGGGAGAQGRNRREDRIARGQTGNRDLFGRSKEEQAREEANWRAYREDKRAEAQANEWQKMEEEKKQEERKAKGDTWGMKEQSSWTAFDDNLEREARWRARGGGGGGGERGAEYDVDNQWGRRGASASPFVSDRQRRRERRQERRQRRQNQPPRQRQAEGLDEALSGEDDWSSFASGISKATEGKRGKDTEEDDFFASLMSELSDTLDAPADSSKAGAAAGDTHGERRWENAGPSSAPSPSTKTDEDDFFESLMSELGGELDSSSSGSDTSSVMSSDEDDFFAALESELSDVLDSDTPAEKSPPKKTVPSTTASNQGDVSEDDFFAALESELNLSAPKGEEDSRDASSTDEDDFFASLEQEIAGTPDDESNKENERVLSSNEEDDFFASLEAELSADLNGNNVDGKDDSREVSGRPASKAPPPANISAPATSGYEDLSKLTVPILKERLRERGLKVSGKKAELIERLQSS